MTSVETQSESRNQNADPLSAYVDPAALMRVKNLQLRAKIVVEGFYNGLHRSPFHGFSAEFSEYRHYTTGDDLRYLDWKLFARSDRYYIKRFEDETNRRSYMVVDLSRSMGYSSLAYTKADYACTLAATFAYYLTLQKDSVGLLTFDESVQDFLPARHRPGHLHQYMSLLQRSVGGQGTDLASPLEQIAALVKKRGLIVLISDLLAPPDSLKQNLSYLRGRGHEVLVLRILDPSEVEFPLTSSAMVQDLETGRELYIDAFAAREEYLERFRAHDNQLNAICDELGIDYYRMQTDQPLEHALFEWLHVQLRRGRNTLRRGRPHSTPSAGGNG